jgi:adsorption protein B
MWGVAWIASLLAHHAMDASVPLPLVIANLALLGWRVAMRAAITGRSHGWTMAAMAPLHMLIGNIVAMLAAWRALGLYAGLVRHGRLRWDKTAHVFPATSPIVDPATP